MNIDERVKKVIASQLNISIESVANSASLAQELGADSLDTVEIMMAMEEEFDQSFAEENIKIVTVQDIIDYITQMVQEAA